MTDNTILQILLFIQVFLLGVIVTVTAQYLYQHFLSPNAKKPPEKQPSNLPNEINLPPALRQNFLKLAEERYQAAVNTSSSRLQKELEMSGDEINDLLKRIATEVVDTEIQHYHLELRKLLGQASSQLGGMGQEIAKHQAELKAELDKEIEAEKKMLIKQIDTKLADAVGSFLVETLGHNIDLGRQSNYLTGLLEEHKAELVKELGNDRAKN